MKKISLLLAILMIMTVVSPSAMAIEGMQYEAMQSKYAKQYVVKTDVEGIVEDANGNYAMVTTNISNDVKTYTPVGRQDFLLTSQESINEIKNMEGIEDETKNTIIQLAQDIQMNKKCDCDECNTVSVYSPDLLPVAQTRASSIQYDEYDGHRMKIEIVSADAHIGYDRIASGMSFENTVGAITGIVADSALDFVLGDLSNIFGTGVTLLQAILGDAGATTVYGKSENECQLKMRYSYTIKHTFAERTPNSGDWALGCLSQSATIDQCLFTYDFYENSKRNFQGDIIVNMKAPIYSEHYLGQNNMKTAWLNINHPYSDSGITVTVGKTHFVLV